jgi:hypothetical protein
MSVVALNFYSNWRYRDSSCVLWVVVGCWQPSLEGGGEEEGEGGGRREGGGEGEGPHSREPRNFPETDRPQLLEPLFACDDQAYTVKKGCRFSRLETGKSLIFLTMCLRQIQAELSTWDDYGLCFLIKMAPA